MIVEQQRKLQEGEEMEETPGRTRKPSLRNVVWVRDWLTRKHNFEQYDQLLTELHREDPQGYIHFLRINISPASEH